MFSPNSQASTYGITLFYGVAHLLVDAVSIAFYFTISRETAFERPWDIFMFYVFFAFAMQAPIGMLADRIGQPILTAVAGCVMVVMGPFFMHSPLVALLILCTGNALFHVGGGMVALSLSQGRATIPGMFVAPGTIGVVIGVTLGHFKVFPHFVFCMILLGVVISLLWSYRFLGNLHNPQKVTVFHGKKSSFWFQAVVLFFTVIVFRSLIADFVSDTARTNVSWQYAIPVAVFLGKFFGGFLSDRFGWGRTILIAILCSAPMIAFSGNWPALLVLGAFLFTMSMPVTLAALGNLLPKRPGFAFGLTALALAVGAISIRDVTLSRYVVFFLICVTASLFYCAMTRYNQSVTKNNKKLTEDMP